MILILGIVTVVILLMAAFWPVECKCPQCGREFDPEECPYDSSGRHKCWCGWTKERE